MAKITDPSFKFRFDENYYTVQGAETLARMGKKDELAAMRSEYTRMRDVAQKRIKRLGKQFPESKAYTTHKYKTIEKKKIGVDEKGKPIYEYKEVTKEGFQELKNIDSRDFAKAFSELAKFVKAKGSTVTGQKQIKGKTIKTWQEQGLNLNRKNYDKAIKILEEMRRRKIVYGSDKVIELADSMLDLDDQQTNEWLDHLDYMLQHTEELQEIPELRGYDFDEIRDMIGD